nr:MAG TPA: hypothetical protein [Bacteriophage sp.]
MLLPSVVHRFSRIYYLASTCRAISFVTTLSTTLVMSAPSQGTYVDHVVQRRDQQGR